MYMKIPEGNRDKGEICMSKKSFYGLKQASSKWNQRLTNFLKWEEMQKLKTDQCIFKEETGELFLAVHLDAGNMIRNN